MATVELVGRLLVSLAVVLGLMWVVARRMRKGGGLGKARGARVIEVLDRAALSKSASVAVVRVNGQAFVLGVADQGVSILGETDLEAALAAKASKPATPARSHRRTAPASSPLRPVAASTPPASTVGVVPSTPGTAAPRSGALAGSALSPQTWRQTVESLRDLTSRT